MRYLLNTLLACGLAFAARAEDRLVIPEGVRYEEASAEVNAKAKQVLAKLFSGKATDEEVLAVLENKTLFCGPFLWHAIKDDKTMAKLEDGIVAFKIPIRDAKGKVTRVETQKGKLFQSADEVLAFWKAFSRRTDFAGFKIRKLNPGELRIFWAMIPFDITEPLFVLDSKKHKILAVFSSPEKPKIMWIDDYQAAGPREKGPAKAANGGK